MSSPDTLRQQAIYTLIDEAKTMLTTVEKIRPNALAIRDMSRAVLNRLYAPDMTDRNELVVPIEYQNNDKIPATVLAPGETVYIPGIANTLTARQRKCAAEVLKQVNGSNTPMTERINAIQAHLSSIEPQSHTIPHDAYMSVGSTSIDVTNGDTDAIAVIKTRPFVLIRNDIMDRYNPNNSTSRKMRQFRTMGGLALLHETMHVDQSETSDAATLYLNADELQAEAKSRAEELRVNGELRAYAFQRNVTSVLKNDTSGYYDLDIVNEWDTSASNYIIENSVF